MHLAGKCVLEGVYGFVSTSGASPANLLEVTEVQLVDDAHVKKALLDFAFDGADVRVLLRALKVRPIVTNNHGDAALGRKSWRIIALLIQLRLLASLQLGCIIDFLLDSSALRAFFQILNTLFGESFHVLINTIASERRHRGT